MERRFFIRFQKQAKLLYYLDWLGYFISGKTLVGLWLPDLVPLHTRSRLIDLPKTFVLPIVIPSPPVYWRISRTPSFFLGRARNPKGNIWNYSYSRLPFNGKCRKRSFDNDLRQEWLNAVSSSLSLNEYVESLNLSENEIVCIISQI